MSFVENLKVLSEAPISIARWHLFCSPIIESIELQWLPRPALLTSKVLKQGCSSMTKYTINRYHKGYTINIFLQFVECSDMETFHIISPSTREVIANSTYSLAICANDYLQIRSLRG